MKAILILLLMIMLHAAIEHIVNNAVTQAGGQPIHINYQIFTDALTAIERGDTNDLYSVQQRFNKYA